MAIYHLSVKAVSRSAGRSATAAAAYRARCEIADERTGEIHDYTRKGGVESADIVLPDGAPEWATDRAKLWNAAEQAETRKDACVAREFEVALPSELSPAERRRLALDFAKDMVNREGCAVDIAIHAPGREGDNRNHHAHILRTTRKVEADGLGAKLDTEKAGRKRSDDLEAVRARWADMTNERLRENGIATRIDHRTLEAQGIDREPTRHLGPAAIGYERRTGEPSQKRQGFEREAAERLARANDLGELERQSRQSDRLILDLSGDLSAAQAERAAPDPLAGFRAVIERAEADGNWLALDVAKAQLAVAQEFQAAGKYPLHHLGAITQEGQRRAFAALAQEFQAKTEPVKAANKQNPEAIKREWQNEKARQFTLIVNRAEELHTRTAVVMERQEGKLANHDQARPAEPAGLFAGFKKAAHGQALAAWRGVRVGLEKRWTQLQNRLHLIGEYMRQAGPYEQPTRGERLAEKKVAQARPDLASNFQQLSKQEKAALAARYQATIAPQQTRPRGRSR